MEAAQKEQKWAQGDVFKKAKKSREQYKETGDKRWEAGKKRWREAEGETLTYSERGGSVCLLLCSTWIHPFLSAFSFTLPRSRSLSLSCMHSHSFHPFLLGFSPFHPRSICLRPSLLPLPFTFIQLGLLCALSFLFDLIFSSRIHSYNLKRSDCLTRQKIL